MDAYLAAKMLFHLYDEDAVSEASSRLLNAQIADNDRSERDWQAVVDAMKKLQQFRPVTGRGATLH